MTVQAYQTLYESSIAYGMRKALMAEQKRNEMTARIKELEEAWEELAEETRKLQQEQEDVVRKFSDESEREDKEHTSNVDRLNALNNDYKNELETLLSTPAK
jgi:dynein light intermediate chain